MSSNLNNKVELKKRFVRQIVPLIKEANPNHFSVFAIAPQPLLVLLGSLFSDQIGVEAYQLKREPKSWQWSKLHEEVEYILHAPEKRKGNPALIISLSATIARDRVTSVLGENSSIWELTIKKPSNDFLKTREQLAAFRTKIREVISQISLVHGNTSPLSVFPAMGVSLAFQLGYIRMPKADMPWVIYDQNNNEKSFLKTITIN